MNVKRAKMIAFGSTEACSLDEYYSAWQFLYDNEVGMSMDDLFYLDKLICDGNVTPKEDYYD